MIRYASCVWELPMPTTFRAYQPNQPLLLPPDLQEWVPPGHLAHHVSDVVDALDLTAFYAPYEGDGRRNAPYEPSMMVKVLIYAYATGTFSSRAVARKLEEDVAFPAPTSPTCSAPGGASASTPVLTAYGSTICVILLPRAHWRSARV